MPSPISTALVLIFALLSASVQPASSTEVPLIFHARDASSASVSSLEASKAFNPASVVKVATTLWALERLGPEHRFETTFRGLGTIDPKTGQLKGDLVVTGGGDPDFHAENVFLVTEALQRAGVREVQGEVRLVGDFWIGWEGGSARRLEDPVARREQMTRRLRRALDPKLWSKAEEGAWLEMKGRRSLTARVPPGIRLLGDPGLPNNDSTPKELALTVVHRSNSLATTLRRLNAYSNNDIERLGSHLGSTTDMEAFVAAKLKVPQEEVAFSTLSGLGRNRLTPKMVVGLLGSFRQTGVELGFEPADVLPRAGCDPGTLRNYPGLTSEGVTTSVVAKTGTLTTTDAGVSVLAGIAATAAGEVIFCVAAPRSGGHLRQARSQKESWLLELIESQGGPASQPCPPPLPFSDSDATILYPVQVPAFRGSAEMSTLSANPS